ncbi:hypothetical protein QFC24_005174 [Naganishia onofrii]|uniref:Uncharacterized protein n=1 Tax=Naganishia onofrii TaxID=1851511 RepID=A0ACC2XA50_9TREE|nr:hypothetical protein QFC24_005174 [Naganishia onofrii]
MLTFGFGIGINVTNAVFVASPPPIGFGFEGAKLAGSYWSPIVGCILGEIGEVSALVNAFRVFGGL